MRQGRARAKRRLGSAVFILRPPLLNPRLADRFMVLSMAQQAFHPSDERLNAVTDRDELWGPLLGFRPEKRRCFSAARVLGVALVAGGFYGLLLNLGLALICRITGHPAPSLFGVPLVLTFTYFVGFQLTLGPAWNRRARLLVRRADYMHSIGRPSDQSTDPL